MPTYICHKRIASIYAVLLTGLRMGVCPLLHFRTNLSQKRHLHMLVNHVMTLHRGRE